MTIALGFLGVAAVPALTGYALHCFALAYRRYAGAKRAVERAPALRLTAPRVPARSAFR